eukprot:1145412-Prymnesium_polylepis.1
MSMLMGCWVSLVVVEPPHPVCTLHDPCARTRHTMKRSQGSTPSRTLPEATDPPTRPPPARNQATMPPRHHPYHPPPRGRRP